MKSATYFLLALMEKANRFFLMLLVVINIIAFVYVCFLWREQLLEARLEREEGSFSEVFAECLSLNLEYTERILRERTPKQQQEEIQKTKRIIENLDRISYLDDEK